MTLLGANSSPYRNVSPRVHLASRQAAATGVDFSQTVYIRHIFTLITANCLFVQYKFSFCVCLVFKNVLLTFTASCVSVLITAGDLWIHS